MWEIGNRSDSAMLFCFTSRRFRAKIAGMSNRWDNEPQYESEIILPPPAEFVEIVPAAGWQIEDVQPVRPRRWRTPLILFLATCLSTLFVGTITSSAGKDWLAAIWSGLRYSIPLMTILVCHEMGHFLQARRYGVPASLPYFIPIPLPPIGTFGAVIGMAPRVGGRRALFDIGISGPLAGLVPALIFCIWGLQLSEAKPLLAEQPPRGWGVGSPLLFQYLSRKQFGDLPQNCYIDLDPMAFAGWVGLFITSLNLIPIGQLDGGHILYALLRRKARKIAAFLLFSALFMVVWRWEHYGNWIVMLFLLFLIGPMHPPTANDDEPLGPWRILLGWLTLAFVFFGFTPTPLFYVG